MSTNSSFARFLRFIGIVLMALTGGFTLLGGIGTSCAALFPTNWESMAPLALFQWLYIIFVLIGIALGVLGIRTTIHLAKGKEKSYLEALYVLISGVLIGFVHIFVSRALRGSSMPVDAVVYTTVLTLVIFLIFRIPAIWQGVDFTRAKAEKNKPAGGVAAILLGILTLTIQYTMGPTHTFGNVNYADAFNTAMTFTGLGLLLLGIGLFVNWESLLASFRKPVTIPNK
jgi:protein-S-isoprenylcysteine O-methyltransferase Ste14